MADYVQNVVKASSVVFDLICAGLGDSRGVHLETAIATAGYLAGTALLRSSKVNFSKIPPGSPIIVDWVNEAGPKLLESLMDICAHNGVDRATQVIEIVPGEHQPLKSYTELIALFDAPFQEIAKLHDISIDLQAPAAVRTVAKFICDGRTTLAPAISLTIAVESIVKGSKTVPPPLEN